MPELMIKPFDGGVIASTVVFDSSRPLYLSAAFSFSQFILAVFVFPFLLAGVK